MGEGSSQTICISLQYGPGRAIPVTGQGNNLCPFQLDGIAACRFNCRPGVVVLKTCSGDPSLDAGRLTTRARRARVFLLIHPRERVVPPLTGYQVDSRPWHSVNSNTSPTTGSENYCEYDTVARARAIDGFGKRQAVPRRSCTAPGG